MNECILVVDDNRSIVRMLELILKRQGFRVVTANDGYEALEKAVEEKPDIMLLDVIMPRMNGYEVCRRVQHQPETSRIQVIFLTVKGRLDMPEQLQNKRPLTRSVDERIAGFDAGAVGFVSKPVSAKKVLDEVEKVLAINEMGKA